MRIHPTELAVLWVVAVHFVFLPWALGTMWPWAQWMSLSLAIIGFLIALSPRDYTQEQTGSTSFRLVTWPKLIRFPIFWIGLAFLGYITLQGFNPAWVYETDGKVWWMKKVEHTSWLPPGYSAPFRRWNPWRLLVVYSAAWLLVCTLWIGFTRRRSVQLLLITLGLNGLLLAVFGVTQRMAKFDKIFGFFTSPNYFFFSSFVYKNHAGAYLLLMLAVTCGLASWFYVRGLRRMEKSNPSAVLAFFASCIAVAILTSNARGVTLIMLVFLVVCIGVFVVYQIRLSREARKPIITIATVLVFGFFLKTGLEALRSNVAWDRIRAGIAREDGSLESREIATRAALEMLQDYWLSGTGAGSFRYLFPAYQARNPEIRYNRETGRQFFWEHAHNDIVQFPIELGVAGMGLIFLALGYWAVYLMRSYFWRNPLSACLILGAGLVLLYSRWDFPFQNPAVLLTWCALWPIATRWAELEGAGSKN